VDLTVFNAEAKLLIRRNGSLFTMKEYESLYQLLKDLTNGYYASSKLIDMYLAGFDLFLSFPNKGITFPIFHILRKYRFKRSLKIKKNKNVYLCGSCIGTALEKSKPDNLFPFRKLN
jgi:hypothetical protein